MTVIFEQFYWFQQTLRITMILTFGFFTGSAYAGAEVKGRPGESLSFENALCLNNGSVLAVGSKGVPGSSVFEPVIVRFNQNGTVSRPSVAPLTNRSVHLHDIVRSRSGFLAFGWTDDRDPDSPFSPRAHVVEFNSNLRSRHLRFPADMFGARAESRFYSGAVQGDSTVLGGQVRQDSNRDWEGLLIGLGGDGDWIKRPSKSGFEARVTSILPYDANRFITFSDFRSDNGRRSTTLSIRRYRDGEVVRSSDGSRMEYEYEDLPKERLIDAKALRDKVLVLKSREEQNGSQSHHLFVIDLKSGGYEKLARISLRQGVFPRTIVGFSDDNVEVLAHDRENDRAQVLEVDLSDGAVSALYSADTQDRPYVAGGCKLKDRFSLVVNHTSSEDEQRFSELFEFRRPQRNLPVELKGTAKNDIRVSVPYSLKAGEVYVAELFKVNSSNSSIGSITASFEGPVIVFSEEHKIYLTDQEVYSALDDDYVKLEGVVVENYWRNWRMGAAKSMRIEFMPLAPGLLKLRSRATFNESTANRRVFANSPFPATRRDYQGFPVHVSAIEVKADGNFADTVYRALDAIEVRTDANRFTHCETALRTAREAARGDPALSTIILALGSNWGLQKPICDRFDSNPKVAVQMLRLLLESGDPEALEYFGVSSRMFSR